MPWVVYQDLICKSHNFCYITSIPTCINSVRWTDGVASYLLFIFFIPDDISMQDWETMVYTIYWQHTPISLRELPARMLTLLGQALSLFSSRDIRRG